MACGRQYVPIVSNGPCSFSLNPQPRPKGVSLLQNHTFDTLNHGPLSLFSAHLRELGQYVSVISLRSARPNLPTSCTSHSRFDSDCEQHFAAAISAFDHHYRVICSGSLAQDPRPARIFRYTPSVKGVQRPLLGYDSFTLCVHPHGVPQEEAQKVGL